MKIFVTGATGFVGSHLCEKLVSDGHEVFGLVRSLDKAKEFEVPGTLIKGSLSTSNPNDWLNQLPNDLDAVIHTAGIVHSLDTKLFFDINTIATKTLFNDLSKKYETLTFNFVSSLAACGPSNDLKSLDELYSPSPVSDYGRSKLLAEDFIKKNRPATWKINIIRPPMVIGPRDPAVLDIFKMVKQGIVLVAGVNGADKKYSFVCVHDLVDIICLANKTANKEVNIFFTSHPEQVTFRSLASEIQAQINKDKIFFLGLPHPIIKLVAHTAKAVSLFIKIDFRLTPDKYNELVPKAWICSGEKATKDLGINYRWNLSSTISETIKDYKDRNWL